MTPFREKRRARRIASDEAHAWARSLRLGNPHAKSLLRAVSLYVDGEGCCFVSLEQLADDADLSVDTARRRMAWLEEIGAIARMPQWLDGNGMRNGDGRGKRTTDLIRLLVDGDPDLVERRAAGGLSGESSEISTAISPSRQPGLKSEIGGPNLDQPSVSPRLALAAVPGPDSSNLEPESPLKSPPGTEEGDAVVSVQESEPDDFAAAWSGYPGREIMRRDLALDAFRQLPSAKQKLCRAAVPLFAAALAKHGRTKPPSMHLWIRSGGFEEFPDAKAQQAAAVPTMRPIVGAELEGLRVAVRIAEQRELYTGAGIKTKKPDLQKDLEALAPWVGELRREGWLVAKLGTPQFAAWRDRLRFWTGIEPKSERIWLEPHDPSVHDVPPSNPNFRKRASVEGFRVPAEWPPRRDGTWSNENEGAA